MNILLIGAHATGQHVKQALQHEQIITAKAAMIYASI